MTFGYENMFNIEIIVFSNYERHPLRIKKEQGKIPYTIRTKHKLILKNKKDRKTKLIYDCSSTTEEMFSL